MNPTAIRLRGDLDKAAEHLAALAGMSKSAYVCQLINSTKIRDMPKFAKEKPVPQSYWLDEDTSKRLTKLSKQLKMTKTAVLHLLIDSQQ